MDPVLIRFVRGWNGYDPGREVAFPHPGLAEDLIRMRIAEPVASGPERGPEIPAHPAPGLGRRKG